jgi:molybdenum cofactor guanylyltransferase
VGGECSAQRQAFSLGANAMTQVAGLILAGGQSRRMGGGDKCLRLLHHKTILARIIERARPQVSTLALNANGDPLRFAKYELPVVPDVVEGFAGPLAGVLTGLEWARVNAPACQWLATFASDAPFLPTDLVARLLNTVEEQSADLGRALSNAQEHPVFGLWRIDLAEPLRYAVVNEGIRKVDAWTARYKLVDVEFAATPIDPFFNVNRPEDLAEAERLLAEREGLVDR